MENVNHEMCENNIMVDEFASIYEIYYERVFKYIFYRVDERYMAEELCSEVFERIITKYNSFSGNELTRDSWVFAIARNTITDYYRKKKKVFHFSLDYAINMISSKPSPDEFVLTEENNSYLIKSLKGLNEKERSIVSFKYRAGLKNVEIAKLMGLSESNVNIIL